MTARPTRVGRRLTAPGVAVRAAAMAAALAAAAGCRAAAARPTSTGPAGAGPAVGPEARPEARPDTVPNGITPHGATPNGAKPDAATVAQVLDGAVPVGRRVRVAGRCLGYGGRADAGPPPRTRSDWLLAHAGRAVYVVGPFPAGCQPMGGAASADVTVTARVAADTLAGLGGPGRPRRYLVAGR